MNCFSNSTPVVASRLTSEAPFSPGICIAGYHLSSLRDYRTILRFHLGFASHAITCRRFATIERFSVFTWDLHPRLSPVVASQLSNEAPFSPGICIPGYHLSSLRDYRTILRFHQLVKTRRISMAACRGCRAVRAMPEITLVML